jgi:bacterioferritin (cytochrome b1)
MKGSSEVITQLNEILKGEVSAVNQYFLHASMIAHRPSGWGTALAEARRPPT